MKPNNKLFKPAVAQLKTAQSIKRPVAPPVYRPNMAANAAQPKMANGPLNRKLPVAPPVYRPLAKKIVQPKIANMIRPFNAVQLAEAKKKGRKDCGATVVAKGGGSYPGEYQNSIHAEINALENYLGSGGTLANISRIDITSQCCKYCYIILSDLGVFGKVVVDDDDREFGSCQGGSYGWFDPDGAVWKAIKAKTGAADVNKYCDTVVKRKKEL